MTETLVDPIAELEQLARRQTLEKDAQAAMTKARVQLVLGKDAKTVFFATLALRLKQKANWDAETAQTDGKVLEYNPEYVMSLSPEQRRGLVAHEVMHNAMSHPSRRGSRDLGRFNIACDLAINPVLEEAGMQLPPGGLFPGRGQYEKLPVGLSAEEYFARLPEEQGQEGDGQGKEGGNGGNDPGKCGGVVDTGDNAQQQASEAGWKVAVAQAANVAKGRGELPGGLARMVGDLLEPKVPWQEVLREFISRALTSRDDYSWSAPNRRFIAQGLYLPSLRSESLGEVVVAIDTSGSIGEAELKTFGGELNGILECRPCKVHVVYCDARVRRVDEWEPSDGPLVLEPVGGGGTSHRPVWDWLAEHDIDPAAVVCLTDGYTSFGDDPGVPVLCALTPESTAEPPFGRVVHIGS